MAGLKPCPFKDRLLKAAVCRPKVRGNEWATRSEWAFCTPEHDDETVMVGAPRAKKGMS